MQVSLVGFVKISDNLCCSDDFPRGSIKRLITVSALVWTSTMSIIRDSQRGDTCENRISRLTPKVLVFPLMKSFALLYGDLAPVRAVPAGLVRHRKLRPAQLDATIGQCRPCYSYFCHFVLLYFCILHFCFVCT